MKNSNAAAENDSLFAILADVCRAGHASGASHRSNDKEVVAEPVSERFNEFHVLPLADEVLHFTSEQGKCSARIDLAKRGDGWSGQGQYRFVCGDYQCSTQPLSRFSRVYPSKAVAIEEAAKQLLANLTARFPDATALPKVQQKELASLRAWLKSQPIPEPPPLPLAGLRFIDLCAGIGGFHQALKSLGGHCVAACEADLKAIATYRENHGDSFPFFFDIQTLDASLLPEFDILCAGFPCQPFSLAGNQEGFADEKRGGIFFHILRLAAARKPALLLLENVEGFATHDGGKTAEKTLDALAEIGYAASMQVLDASEFGLPQKRKRIFIVAQRVDLVEEDGNPFVFPTGSDSSCVVADILEENADEGWCDKPVELVSKPANPSRPITVGLVNKRDYQGDRVYSPQGKGITLLATAGGTGRQTGLYLVNGKARRLTPRECARMQGFGDDFKLHPSAYQARKQFGNSVAVPVVAALAQHAVQAVLRPPKPVQATRPATAANSNQFQQGDRHAA